MVLLGGGPGRGLGCGEVLVGLDEVALRGGFDAVRGDHVDDPLSRDVGAVHDLADLLGACGCSVRPVSDDVFARSAAEGLKNEFGSLFGIVRDIAEQPVGRPTEISSNITTEVLRGLGFSWPKIDEAYFSSYFTQIQAAIGASMPTRKGN